jgi:hypothetical protein
MAGSRAKKGGLSYPRRRVIQYSSGAGDDLVGGGVLDAPHDDLLA